MKHRTGGHWKVPTAFALYVLTALLLLQVLQADPPPWLEVGISLVAAPLFWIFQPLYPVLQRLGLMEGEAWRLPSPLGFVVATGLYCVLLWSVFAVFRRRPLGRDSGRRFP